MFALLYKRQPGNKMSSHSYRHCLTKNSRITTYKVFLSLQLTSNARLIHSAEISSPHSKLTWAMIPYFHDLFSSICTLANSLVLFSTTSLKNSWISILKDLCRILHEGFSSFRRRGSTPLLRCKSCYSN